MRVATITFGNSQNLGALLQAHALQKYLKELGHECKIIKFLNFDNRPFETIKGFTDAMSDIVYYGKCKSKIRKINKFRKEYLDFTDKTYFSASEMEELNDSFDCFIAGSDQIWNVHKGVVNEFFLPFVKKDRIKMAYSASFGLSVLPGEYIDEVKKLLKGFNAISIREKTGVEIAKELTGNTYLQTLDPVFLLSKEYWEEFAGERIVKENYIFVYPTQITDALINIVKEYKKKTNCKVYSLFHFVGTDKVIKDADPIEFVNYIKYADMVIGSSFHATAFSVIFEKELRVIPHSKTGARVVDLLEDLGLGNAIINQNDCGKDKKLDYSKAREVLADKIKTSKNYLRENTIIQ